jgi:hypothetical protein
MINHDVARCPLLALPAEASAKAGCPLKVNNQQPVPSILHLNHYNK